jgi:fibronectin type 3 domain-containing protein
MILSVATPAKRFLLPIVAIAFAVFSPVAFGQNFTLNAGVRSSVIVPQGGTGTYTINVVPTGGFAGSVTFSASGLPAGVTASFSPMSSTTSTTLTLTASGSATLGTKDVTVTGTNALNSKTVAIAVMITAADPGAAFTWPSYDPNLNFDFKTVYPDIPNPTGILNDTTGVAGTVTSEGSWHFRYGANKNKLVTSAAWTPMLNRLNYDFAWFRENLGWPADLRHRNGYFSGVYLFGSGLGTDTASNTDGGGWQSATNYQGTNWPMILMSYYPVYSFDPNCPYGDRVGQQGATVHEGIHAMFADAPGVKNAAWFHEGGNTYLQGEQAAQLTGDYGGMGWLSATSALAPFMPIECYSGWLQDGSFGGPAAEGVHQGDGYGSTWRQLFGGVQYSEAFPHFLHEVVSPGSVAWIWQNCPTRVLEGLSNSTGGLGPAQMRRLIMEYRARMALCDIGRWSGAYQSLLNNNWNASLGPEYTPYWIQCDPWTATCYQPTTNNLGVLTPQSKTLPGWSGANYIPLTTTNIVGTTVSVNFNPLGNSQIITANSGTTSVPEATTATSNNMTCQLVYRAADGSAVYGQPVSSGTCSIRLDKAARNNVVIAVITSTDFVYAGDSSRKTKFDYRLTLGTGLTGAADVNTKWYQTIVQPAVKAIAGDGENHIFWGPVAGATSYTLKRATAPGGPYTNLITTGNWEYTDTGRTNGTTYYYIATASDATRTSVNSNEAAATPVASAVTTGNFSFETPNAGTGSTANPAGAAWAFTGVAGVTNRASTYANDNRFPPNGAQSAFLQNKASISQAISGFTPGSSYTVRFLASQRQSIYQLGNIFDLKVDGRTIKSFFPLQMGSTWGEYSATFTATAATQTISFHGTNANGGTSMVLLDRVLIVPAPAASVPAAPVNLTGNATADAINLAWKISPLAASYTVKRSTTSGSGYTTLASNVLTPEYIDTSAVLGTVYYYVVTAVNSLGESGNSNQIVARRAADLQVHLKFDETTGGTASDSSGNGYNGTVNSGAWGAGKTGNAVVLNGTSSHVTLPANSLRALNDYTIATWVKLNSFSTWSRIFDFGSSTDNYLFLTPQYTGTKPGILRFGAKVPGKYEQVMDSTIAITTGAWTHVAVTQSGAVAKLYVNGKLAAVCPSMPVTPATLGATTANYIGRSRFADPYLNGSVDDFRIYNRALGGSEINALAGTHVGKTPAVAYWNFEEGAADAYVPYGNPNAGYFDGSVRDLSGNENHLSAWNSSWEWYRSNTPAATTPNTGLANTRSVQNANTTPGMSAVDTALTTWKPVPWTIEAAIRPDAVSGFQTFIGRDSQGANAGQPALAALYFSVRPNGVLALQFTDAAGNNWNLQSAASSVVAGKWHAVAATSDGATLRIYLRNLTDSAPAYTLLGSLDISSSSNPAITTGDGDGTNWDAGVFTVGRGLYNGAHTDRFIGFIDDVRLSGTALAPDQMLYSVAPQVPAGLSASPASTSQINLTWSASAGATSYQVKRSTASVGPFTSVATGITATTFNDTGLASATTYYYVVSAENAMGESGNSAQASATSLTASQNWRQTRFGTTADSGAAAFTADPDGDALTNLWEYFHGSDPSAANATSVQQQFTNSRLSITFVRDTTASDLTVDVQAADSPAGPWTDIARSINGAVFGTLVGEASVTETGTGPTRTVVVRDIYDTGDAQHPRRFLRLKGQSGM